MPPYVIIAHNPAAYFGVNAYVMHKHGFADTQIDDIAKAYRNIYQSNISVYNALRRIEADVEPSEIRSEIIDFVRGNGMKIVALPVDFSTDPILATNQSASININKRIRDGR